MDEAEFLARIRARKTKSEDDRLKHPGRYGRAVRTLTQDLVTEFVQRLTAVGGHVHLVKDAPETRVCLRDILNGRRLKRAAMTGHPILYDLELDGLLGRMGIEVVSAAATDDAKARGDFVAATAQAALGLTGAEYGLAASGSLVMAATTFHARAVSLLPPLHVAVLHESQLVPDLAALSNQIQQDYRGRPPSGLVLITGPSRTADIEQTLSVGVHGPGEIHVLLLRQ